MSYNPFLRSDDPPDDYWDENDEWFDDMSDEERAAEFGEMEEDRDDFADPGGRSALRRATPDNPRNQPCPTCGRPNMLTPKDVALHYQCDICADALEGGYDL